MVFHRQFQFFLLLHSAALTALTCRCILVLQATRQQFLTSDATVLLYWFLSLPRLRIVLQTGSNQVEWLLLCLLHKCFEFVLLYCVIKTRLVLLNAIIYKSVYNLIIIKFLHICVNWVTASVLSKFCCIRNGFEAGE